ncbi:hypothetical protein DPEC_G00277800 [Dallia pectoralis]|uniref:Uncharacterized protein n=1 Tax=Dallia pectoralis TaxID=75939 RepID=A0ACC2FLZ7_DALPE|nr:hypothetical protein DPEC_G00277800 [Dallia pectoralis]
MTTEITNIAYNRAIDDENEFDEQKERHRLHELLRHNHAKSVYGSAASSISHSQSDHYSIPSVMTAKRADAAAELAVKEAHYQMLLEEERQKELIRELEEQQRKALEAQKRELERLQAEKEIRAARAKLESYNKETERENANYVKEERNVEAKSAPLTASPPPLVASPCHTDTSTEKGNLRDVKKNEASALNTQTVNEHNNHKSEQWKVKTPCILCQDSRHQLHACSKFTDMVLGERRNYIREKKLCYGCLKPGHSARDCRHRHSCDQCKGKHPTALHDDNYKREGSESEPPETNQSAAATSLSIAGEGSSNTSMVIPVWVSSKNDPTAEKLVYALLDTQSDTTFIDQDVSDVLNVDKFPVKLKLTTMSGRDTVLTSEGVSGLRVRGYSSSIPVDLPVAYTKDCIPVNRSHIPTCETAKQWSHLAEIVDEIQPLKDCAVGLLIGYNCSRAMAPRQVLLGGDEEPYAVYQCVLIANGNAPAGSVLHDRILFLGAVSFNSLSQANSGSGADLGGHTSQSVPPAACRGSLFLG